MDATSMSPMPNDLDAIVGELREKLAVVAGSHGVYAQMDRFELWRDNGPLIDPDNLLAKFACGDHAAYKALPAVASILGNLLPRLLAALTPPAAMPETQTPAAGVGELADMLRSVEHEEGVAVFNHGAEEIGILVMENYSAILATISRAAPASLAVALQAQEEAEDAREACPECGGDGQWEHCGPCSLRFGRAIDLRRAALAAEQPRKPDEDGERLRKAATALVDRFPAEMPDYSPAFDEVSELRAALGQRHD